MFSTTEKVTSKQCTHHCFHVTFQNNCEEICLPALCPHSDLCLNLDADFTKGTVCKLHHESDVCSDICFNIVKGIQTVVELIRIWKVVGRCKQCIPALLVCSRCLPIVSCFFHCFIENMVILYCCQLLVLALELFGIRGLQKLVGGTQN